MQCAWLLCDCTDRPLLPASQRTLDYLSLRSCKCYACLILGVVAVTSAMAAAQAGGQRFVSGASRCRVMCPAALWLHTASFATCKLEMLSALTAFST